MSLKQQLLDLIAALPDEETAGEVTATETGETAATPDGQTLPDESTIEPSTVENTEVEAPPIDNTDVTIMTSEDALETSIEMRLASFYAKQEELENTVKILLQEVNTLKGHFEVIETAIETAAETSPTVESIEKLINQL